MRVIVVGEDGSETDLTEEFRVTYDVAVGSMDFGSGFLDTEEVEALKRVARSLGAEAPRYQHDKCAACGHDRERHNRNLCWTDDLGGWLRRGSFYLSRGEEPRPACSCVSFEDGA